MFILFYLQLQQKVDWKMMREYIRDLPKGTPVIYITVDLEDFAQHHLELVDKSNGCHNHLVNHIVVSPDNALAKYNQGTMFQVCCCLCGA